MKGEEERVRNRTNHSKYSKTKTLVANSCYFEILNSCFFVFFFDGCNISKFKKTDWGSVLIVMVVTWMWAPAKAPWAGHLQWVHVPICKLYLSKSIFKRKDKSGICWLAGVWVSCGTQFDMEVHKGMRCHKLRAALRVCPLNFRTSGQVEHPLLWGRSGPSPPHGV